MTPRTTEQNEVIREQTRLQIQKAAFELFARKGFSETSVSSIAAKAGVSKGLIYHYFRSKKEILIAIFDDLASIGDQALDFPDELSPAGCLEQMLRMSFGFIKEQTETMKLLISLALQPDAMAELKPLIEQHSDQQVEILTQLLCKLGYEDPENEAYYLAAILDGIALGHITLKGDYPFNAITQKILDEYVPKTEHH